ncbi:MAG: NAD(P)/FAD-dependent oxidoreductase [Sphingomonadaceae bacterium]|nr:NAD(P)/FAD-dependent oxidoreductase [Sphingomonadaceae bacterium]
MSKIEGQARPDLAKSTDAEIEEAVKFADPMALRGLLYQLTGDEELKGVGLKTVLGGYLERKVLATDDDLALVRRKAAEFLKSCRDPEAVPMDIGPRDRLPTSLGLMRGETIPKETLDLYIEETALDPWVRSPQWRTTPDPERLKNFRVVIVGAGMGGLVSALHLKRVGIPFTVIEKNAGVGGTWYENRYPGSRLDTPSRSYTHLFGVDFPYSNPFSPWSENQRYFSWVADFFDLRKHIVFETEVHSLTWDEETSHWEIATSNKDGEKVLRANAVMTSVGFLNLPKLPDIEGRDTFEGEASHTVSWPDDAVIKDKRVAVVGTGATGYQTVPEMALEANHVTVFQRTPQWVFPAPGYRSPFAPQVSWLNRNFPFYTNFMRLGSGSAAAFEAVSTIDPDFDDPHCCSPSNKIARDVAVGFLKDKLKDPALVEMMTPEHPVWSARPIQVDPEYCILDAIQRDNVTLVTDGIRRINPTGIETMDGRQIDVDVIAYATGFHANEYLFPMEITGRGGQTIEQLWSEGGARAYRTCMMPGFPNLFAVYGPNTNGSLLPATFHEMVVGFAIQCMQEVILEEKSSVEVETEPYWDYNRMIDERNNTRVWSDPRVQSYYWSKHGRSATMNPLPGPEMWRLLHEPEYEDLEFT